MGLSMLVPFVVIPTGMDWKLQAKNAAVNEAYYKNVEVKLKNARLKYDELDKEYFSIFNKHLPAPNLIVDRGKAEHLSPSEKEPKN